MKFRAGVHSGVVALGLVLSAPAPAQSAAELADLSLAALLDMEVTGSSRSATRRSESAAAVSVITRDEIRALGHRTLAEALRGVRGAAVSGDRTYDYLGVRGFFASGDYNTRVLLLVDGNRINDALYDQAMLGQEFPLDLDLVERIEFVPGQGSAVYGANALFGVINVITRAPLLREGRLALGWGTQGERVLRGLWQQPTADGGWRVAASRSLYAGEALADATLGAGPQRVAGLESSQRSALHARWDHGPWSASLISADRRKGLPLVLDLVFGDPTNRYRDTVHLASLQHELALGPDSRLTTRVHAGDYRFVGDYAIDYPPVTHNRDYSRGRWWGLEARVTSTRWAGHRLVAGIEWQQSLELTQRSYDIAPGQDVYLDDRRHAARGALFAEDQLRLAEHWTLHLGARLDQLRHGERATSPRVALAWRPLEALSLKAIHGRAFRAPNAYEAHYEVDTAAGYLANPALSAERVRGDELSAEWLPAPHWRLSGSLYRNRAERLLVLNYLEALDRLRFENAGVLTARGAEFELEHAGSALRWRLNASFNENRTPAGETVADTYPRRMLKGMAIWPLAHGWRVGAEWQALGRRGGAPGHALAHLTLSGPLPALGGELQLALRNAFDRAAQDPGADAARQPVLPQPGRQWRLELSWPLGR